MTEKERAQRVAAYIERNLEGDVSLDRLSKEAGVSRFHLQRSFKKAVGVTPRQFAEACRLRSLKKNLRESGDLLDAVYGAGFGSASRVYERVDSRLGMTPGQYRGGAVWIGVTYATVKTPLGLLMIGATDRGVSFVQFGDSADALEAELRREFPGANITPAMKPWPKPLREWIAALNDHLKGAGPLLDLPLDLRATAFQMRVWLYLQSIPYGETRTYKDVAVAIGKPKSSRAVAQACAANRTALLIPCHRVIRASGQLSGYRWGVERKKQLLEQERSFRSTAAI